MPTAPPGKIVNIEAPGPHPVAGGEITVILLNANTYTKKDQIGNSSYEIPNLVGEANGKSLLSYLGWIGSIVIDGKLDFDIVFWDSAPTVTSTDGNAFELNDANIAKHQFTVIVREDYWDVDMGANNIPGGVPPWDLGHEIKCIATSGFVSFIWRGPDLLIGPSESLKFKIGSNHIGV